MDVSGILKVVAESKRVDPSEEKQLNTSIGSGKAFQELLQKSKQDPEAFWNDVARLFPCSHAFALGLFIIPYFQVTLKSL
ncbi:hypothetical protein [Neobacillus cucumis]|uniref:hypothetical protein n=1 Tax=Neobacillus cucumis TaxID=1740721 RepID=UPI001EF7E239|nr:hypothetical protein [Neobacillus cucumis]MBM7655208.1 hypothetical protein [Neobacillus cucumis]